ncbi:hypothetical protein CRE_02615 [Caenorhabditis remanei]|uniref:Uncharacterized protein n=1 Tax=Caenorhabditis remanei TaxID=31234 RepID=E3NDA9_CAERE|nr:hypothetical protein CRE_02615 [Caenorhabditis remanei]
MMKEAQKQQVKTVDSSPEVGGVVDGSTEDSGSSEVHTTLTPPGTIHVGPDTIVMNGREHIHDPEHGNDDAIVVDHKMQKVQMFGGEDVEIGGNSEMPKTGHDHDHHKYNPEIEKQEFKKGWAPTEILWSPSIMANGYNGGVRRPDYRHFVAAQRH